MSHSTFPKLFALLMLALFLGADAYAQAPGLFKFQAVAREPGGDPYASENIAVRVSLVRGGISGQVDYSERHEVTTTDLGVFDLAIGGGTQLTGDFLAADWAANTYFLKIDIDPDNGSNYLSLGASQLMSVPYALYARESGSGGGGDPTDELQNLIFDAATNTLTITSGNSVTLTGGGGGSDDQTLTLTGTIIAIEGGNSIDLQPLLDAVDTDDADADPANEIQTLSIAANVLTLSDGGGSVTLPAGGGGGSDNQGISLNGTIVTLERGGSIDLASILPPGGTDDQTLTLNGSVLTLEDGGTVDLAPLLQGAGGGTDNQQLSLNGTVLALEDGGTVDLAALTASLNVDDADADPANELQTLALNGTVVGLSNGNSIDLAGILPPGGTDDQALTLNGTILTLEDGGSVDLAGLIPPGGSDDQQLTLTGTSLSIEDGNAVDLAPLVAGLNVDDADADPANELQTLSLNGSSVELSDGGSVDLAPLIPAGGTDDQQLSLAGTTLSLEDGGSVDLASVQDGFVDADADPANELQTLSLNGSTIALSDGGAVDLAPLIPAGGTDDQQLSLAGTTLSLEDGGTVDLAVVRDGVDDADADPANELQTLSLNGNTLELSNGGGTADLSGLAGGTTLWTAGNNNAVGYNSGNVGVGTTSPDRDLTVVNTSGTSTAIAIRNPDAGSIRQLTFESQVNQQRAGLWSYGPNASFNAGELNLFNSAGPTVVSGDEVVMRTSAPGGGLMQRMNIDEEGRFRFGTSNTRLNADYAFFPRDGENDIDIFLDPEGASSRSYLMLRNGGGNLLSIEASRATGAFTAAGVALNNMGYITSTQTAEGLMIQSRTVDKPLHLASESRVGLTVLNGNIGIGTQAPTEQLDVSGNARLAGRGQLIFGDAGAEEWSVVPVNNGGTLRWLYDSPTGPADLFLEMRPSLLSVRKALEATESLTVGAEATIGDNLTVEGERILLGSLTPNNFTTPGLQIGEDSGSQAGGIISLKGGDKELRTFSRSDLDYIRMLTYDGPNIGSGKLEIRAEQTFMGAGGGSVPTQSRNYAAVVYSNNNATGGFGTLGLISRQDPTVEWELHPNSVQGALDLNYQGSRVGEFNPSTGAYAQLSDERLKQDIVPLAASLGIVSALHPKAYTYKASGEAQLGFLAQELAEVLPAAVRQPAAGTTGEADDTYLVEYTQLIPVAIGAIQEQQAVIDAQAERIDDLEARLARLEALLND